MKKNSSPISIPISIQTLSIITGITAAISFVLRIISLFFFYDDVGYYKTGAILPIISNTLIALSLIFILFAAIFSIDKKQSVEPTSKLSQYAALLPMGAAVFHLLRAFTTPFNDTFVNKYLFALSAIAAVVFFFLIFFAKKSLKNITFYVGVGALLYVTLCWMFTYFDFFVPINSTDKTFFYLASASALLFIFNEMCACYGFVRARFYYFSLFGAIIVLGVSSISAVIGYFCGIIKAYITLEADIFFIALLIYAITRLIDAQKSRKIEEPTMCEEKSQENIANDSE